MHVYFQYVFQAKEKGGFGPAGQRLPPGWRMARTGAPNFRVYYCNDTTKTTQVTINSFLIVIVIVVNKIVYAIFFCRCLVGAPEFSRLLLQRHDRNHSSNPSVPYILRHACRLKQ